jgi:hypothetical protein
LPIALPNDLELTKDVVYRWRFEVQSVPLDYVEGNFSLEPEEIPDFIARLTFATSMEYLTVAFDMGWWYDAFTLLLLLRIYDPNNVWVQNAWIELLDGEGLSDFLNL